ncbi:MAG TPA: selenocysteine-specific translation elongation factor [Gaiellaceae bacterium]|nr:selenocysteine-specific translation elongation factor [Gaiellaceae bacterium]
MPLTVGTAGHIDHGKTWLVRALTGKDTDRLPEERERGISIDLGYAPLELPDGRRLSLIDVPGHERFVRNMVAGATGIDLFLLVIDAGEGARPQTHEHLAILRLLGIDRGVVAVTKADAVDEETRELALAEAAELVPEARVLAVSAKTGEGIAELRSALAALADDAERARTDGPARLYVDRVFTLRGIGTVVTGTLWSGTIGEGDELRVEPRGIDVRVRSVQVHDAVVARAEAGQRVAVNLPGLERTALARGDALVERRAYPVTFRLDVVLEEVADVPAAVTVHLGTSAVPARVARRGRFAQLRLEQPLVAARGDRVVLRTSTTVGGGVVLDPRPPRRIDPQRLELLEQGDAAATVHAPVRIDTLRHLLDAENGLERAGEWIFSRAWLDELRAGVHAQLAGADPLDPGIDAPAAPWAAAVVPLLGVERRGSRLYLPGAKAEVSGGEELLAEVEAAGLAGAKVADAKRARALEQEGRLVRLGDGFAVTAATYERARTALVEECRTSGKITLARFRDLLGIGRRSAQLLLERFDADGVTRRVGDERVLRRAAR